MMPPLRQVSRPCPQCGSYYRRGAACNICGRPQDPAEIAAGREQPRSMPRGHGRHGKYHRYEKITRY